MFCASEDRMIFSTMFCIWAEGLGLYNSLGFVCSKERKWKDSKEDGKFLEKCASSIWNSRGKKCYFFMEPTHKNLSVQQCRENVE